MDVKFLNETNELAGKILSEEYENFLKHKIEYQRNPNGRTDVDIKGPIVKTSFTASTGQEGYKAKRMIMEEVADKARENISKELKKQGIRYSNSSLWEGDRNDTMFIGFHFEDKNFNQEQVETAFKKIGLKPRPRKSSFSKEFAYAVELGFNDLKKWM